MGLPLFLFFLLRVCRCANPDKCSTLAAGNNRGIDRSGQPPRETWKLGRGSVNLEPLVLLNPTMPSYWERMGEASKKSRDYPNAIRGFRRALELGASYPGPTAYEVAVCYALSGDKENALLWLKKALSLGLRSLAWVQDDPQLESLRTDPRFQSLAMVADVQSMTRDQGWRYDLQFLASELKRRHYSPFRKISKEEFDGAVAKLDSRIPNLKDEEIEVEFMRLARMMGDGHTYLRPKHTLASNVRALPIQLFFFTEGLFIIRASSEHRDLVGMRVDRIGEHTPQNCFKRLTRSSARITK